MIQQASAIHETAPSKAFLQSGRLTVGPIHNEQQETMFDSELSLAVDDLVTITKNIKRAKDVKSSLEVDLIRIMKKNRIGSLNFEGGTIRIEQSDEKIKIKLDENFQLKEADF